MTDCAIVIATYNRSAELLRTLAHLTTLPERPAIVVVDNGCTDNTSAAVNARYPDVRLVRLPKNIGAAARTVGALEVEVPFIAFCDDDGWWTPGALARAVEVLREHPRLALLNARYVVGDEQQLDPACREMAKRDDRSIAFFLGGACVMRRSAFLEVGGYHHRFHIGAEESLVALDLAQAGWELRYLDDLIVHHYPSTTSRFPQERRRLVMRNRLWTAWLRGSMSHVVKATLNLMRDALQDHVARAALCDALRGIPWVLRERRPVSAHLQPSFELMREPAG